MPNTAQSDIAYQPAQKGFSYTNSAPTPESSEPKEKKPNVILPLILEIFTLIVVFLVFLGVLNYFRIISLSFVSPKLAFLPQKQTQIFTPEIVSTDESGAITYKTTGTFYSYNKYVISIKYNTQILNFQWNNKSRIFLVDKTGKQVNTSFLSDLESSKNLGKKITIEFTTDTNGNYIIQSISLAKD